MLLTVVNLLYKRPRARCAHDLDNIHQKPTPILPNYILSALNIINLELYTAKQQKL